MSALLSSSLLLLLLLVSFLATGLDIRLALGGRIFGTTQRALTLDCGKRRVCGMYIGFDWLGGCVGIGLDGREEEEEEEQILCQ